MSDRHLLAYPALPMADGRIDLLRFFCGWIDMPPAKRVHLVSFNPVDGMKTACGTKLRWFLDASGWILWPADSTDPTQTICKRCERSAPCFLEEFEKPPSKVGRDTVEKCA